MSNPLWIDYRENTHGVNSDGFPDVSNRPNRTLWSNFTTQHDKDGDHKSDLITGIWSIEQGTYTGNGTDNRTISLTDTGLNIKFLRIFEASTAYSLFVSEDTPAGYTLSTEGLIYMDYILSVGTGEFTISDNAAVNTNARTYYYTAWGV